jgi:glucosamine--fructose-6-phosphate aminotransferase (isomerizing)
VNVKAAGELMRAEIAAQPQMIANLLDAGDPALPVVIDHLRRQRPRFVLLAARGTSDHAALYGKYLVEIEWGLPAGLASMSTATLYQANPDLRDVLFLTVSQSGASPDLVDPTARARDCGATTVALTNNPGSALAQAAGHHLDIRAARERAVAATKTYTAELLGLYQLITGLSGTCDASALAALPDAAATTLDRAGRVGELVTEWGSLTRLVATGRGFAYPTAREAAVKIIETSYLSAHAYSGADFLHGPLAMIDHDTLVLAIRTRGADGDSLGPVLERLRPLTTRLIEVGPAAGLPVDTRGMPESLHPIVQILPLQRLALELDISRGLDPDLPRSLSKVTETW